MSKLACTILSNMLAWGLETMIPRNHDRHKSVSILIDTLNDDAEFKAIFNGMELKPSSVKKVKAESQAASSALEGLKTLEELYEKAVAQGNTTKADNYLKKIEQLQDQF